MKSLLKRLQVRAQLTGGPSELARGTIRLTQYATDSQSPGSMFAWPHLVVKVGLGLAKEAVPHGFQQLWRQPIPKQAEEAEEVA
ncbi:hypothetical protein Isop_1291 [Isosphaera pallida ATCC 43644]|uniref:Uncharacterized protein n=1 Tax=Isosphaera pallida (strain ATCC 43644 / DSM 9630 / IS1B) TaxID=575540 RepID=E8QWI5_ISOPI|nr:hypothetical protein Isop_1291 [Isosphaera pallida ATCC 43644]